MVDLTDVPERLTDLEVKLAYQDHLLKQLDDVLRQLMDQLDATKRDVAALKATQHSPTSPAGPTLDRPPHY